jgi:Ca2+-binding RTX toxin-like protein
MLIRNNLGDGTLEGHARDADMILGDNGNIYRLVGTDGTYSGDFLTFNYDNYTETMNIIPRAAELLDYTPGWVDYDAVNAAYDIGAPDEIHGESGDDFLYGMKGDDVIFGEGQDDDIIGGYGNDWISGGTGQDGVLGDDGRIYTSRNGTAEPLYSISATVEDEISTPGNIQYAVINIEGELKKTVNLTPFNIQNPATLGDMQDPLYDALYADDIIYGGLGNDFLHGGSGDDAISGAEALQDFYEAPFNPGDVLGFGEERAGEFYAYNEYEPRVKITGFLLNFDPGEGSGTIPSDGDDCIFGDLGNDWLVGGTGRDHLYGGWGSDLLNADDDLDTNGGLNDAPDGPEASYEDIAYGGAGRDYLIANTGGDRLIDWAGEFNSYIVPFAPFGLFTIWRAPQPQLMDYLYDLSEADGADPTRADDTGADSARNGEPEGELGLVNQRDFAWRDQTGRSARCIARCELQQRHYVSLCCGQRCLERGKRRVKSVGRVSGWRCSQCLPSARYAAHLLRDSDHDHHGKAHLSLRKTLS